MSSPSSQPAEAKILQLNPTAMDVEDVDEAFEDYDVETPAWLRASRGFLDMPAKAADDINEFLAMHLPLTLNSWAISHRR